MDAQSQLLAELNRQIKDAEEAVQRQDNAIIDKDAQIERLKADLDTEKKTADKFLYDLQTQTRLAGNYMAKLFTAQELITDLACSLEGWSQCDPTVLPLIQRALEATKSRTHG